MNSISHFTWASHSEMRPSHALLLMPTTQQEEHVAVHTNKCCNTLLQKHMHVINALFFRCLLQFY